MARTQKYRSPEDRRAAWLKGLMPPGMTAELADEFMRRLTAGDTLRKITSGDKRCGPALVTPRRFKKHCQLHPEWGVEAIRLAKVNAKAADALKSPILRGRMHCKRGHSLEGARVYRRDGYPYRFCLECRKIVEAKGGILRPEVGQKIKAALQDPNATIKSITGSGRPGYLLRHVSLKAYCRADPEIERLVAAVVARAPATGARNHRLHWQRIRNDVVREENNDYYDILAMLPANFPGRDDVVSDIFEALLGGNLKREDVRSRVQAYVAAHNRMFPTKYAKFGDSPLVSLDEVLFDGGTATRADVVSRGLWD